jgi:hypothetical protein
VASTRLDHEENAETGKSQAIRERSERSLVQRLTVIYLDFRAELDTRQLIPMAEIIIYRERPR